MQPNGELRHRTMDMNLSDFSVGGGGQGDANDETMQLL